MRNAAPSPPRGPPPLDSGCPPHPTRALHRRPLPLAYAWVSPEISHRRRPLRPAAQGIRPAASRWGMWPAPPSGAVVRRGPCPRRRRDRGASREEEARPLAGFGEGGGGGGAEAVAAAPNRGKRGPCSAARCTLCPRVERPPPRSSKEEAPPDARREEGGARRGGSAQGMGGSGRRCRAAQLSAVEEELEEGRAGGVGGREGEGARARVQGAARFA